MPKLLFACMIVGISLLASPAPSLASSLLGCSDGAREGYVDTGTYPLIAGCSGGWTIPGILLIKPPHCGLGAGDDSANPVGNGCAAEDLCAAGWHICASADEVRVRSVTGCSGAARVGEKLFFATRQSGPGDSWCGQGSNDVFGCGTLGADIYRPNCGVLTKFTHNNCSLVPPPWACYGEVLEALNITKRGASAGGVLCCKGRDSDGDGRPDTLEDKNGNGVVDPGETDPNAPDTDGDGLTDGQEDANLNGTLDPGETNPTKPDSDADGLSDGLERGFDHRGRPIAGASLTNPLVADTDEDGLLDGVEDANRDGVYDDGVETDPRVFDTDGGGVGDGQEVKVDGTNPLVAADDNTCGDGVKSGLESDVDCGGPVCLPCEEGKHCSDHTDCISGVCTDDGICAPARCDDGVQNNQETDIDCGGPTCPACEEGKQCSDGTDCVSGVCTDDGICAPASCDDGVQNNQETDIDCGGPTCPDCEEGKQCSDGTDCVSGICTDGVCAPPTNDAGGPSDGGVDGGGEPSDGGVDGGGAPSDGGVNDGGFTRLDSGDNLGQAKLRYVGGGCAVQPAAGPGATTSTAVLFALLGAIFTLTRRGRRRQRRPTRTSTLATALVFVALLFGWQAQAQAQAQFSVLRLRPAASPLNYYTTEGTETLPHLSPSVGLYLHYDHDPLRVLNDATGEPLYEEVAYQLNMELLAAIGFWNRLELGLALPVALTQDEGDSAGDGTSTKSLSGGIGDLRIIPKVRLVTVGPFSATIVVSIDLPTGDADAFLGDGSVGVEPRAVLGLNWERFGGALNVGVRIRPEQEAAFAGAVPGAAVDDELFLSLGGRAGLWRDRLDAIVDGSAFLMLHDSEQSGAGGEILGGLRAYLPLGLSANLAAGPGIGRGTGIPAFRVLAGLHYQYLPQAEPAAAPVIDLDGDGIPDERDHCPSKPEDRDDFEDSDGCPDPDNDKDGLLDAQDGCPNEREDVDGFQDEDGCPDPDNDGDGIPDANDRCPLHAETANGVDDEDGCPDEGRGEVRLRHDKITVPAVHFETNKVRIMPQSFQVLEIVSQLLRDNPWIKRVRVEGHTDDTGTEEVNQRISTERAAVVAGFLMERSIDAERLESAGFGESRPLVEGTSTDARAQNRRVEFIIVDPAPASPGQ